MHPSVSVTVSICIVLWMQSIHSSNLEFHMKLNNLSICIVLSWSQSIHPSNLEFQMKLNNLSICIHPNCISIHLYLYLSVICIHLYLYLYLYPYLYPSVLYYHGYNHRYNLSIHQILWMFFPTKSWILTHKYFGFHHNTMDIHRNPEFHT